MEENKLSRNFMDRISGSKENVNMYSPTQLAYVGDAVYEILVRTYVLNNQDVNVNRMHKITVKFVKAKAQAYILSKLKDELTEEEKRIAKRGRNAKVNSSPKNVDFMEYRYATGFEALIGYLYLSDRIDRLLDIFDRVIEIILEKDD